MHLSSHTRLALITVVSAYAFCLPLEGVSKPTITPIPVRALTPKAFQQLAGRIDRLAKSEEPHDFFLVGEEIHLLQLAAQANDRLEFKKQRRLKTQLWLRILTAASNRLDPAFDRNDLPMLNIAPDGPYDSGIHPKGIKDPNVRLDYENAIQQNARKARRYNLQGQLRRYLEWWPKLIFMFVGSHFDKSNKDDQQELAKLLKDELPDKELRDELAKTFKQLDEQYDVSRGAWVVRPKAKKPKSEP